MACILVADDDPEQLTMLRKLLEALGYEVATAASREAALVEIGRRRPNFIAVDLGLPHASDGLRLIREIHQLGYPAPVVLLSGWPDEIYGAPEEKMVSRVLMKGDVRELLKAIKELLAA